MRQVAHINGVNVYSDKQGSISIYGSCITFADDSSCDVRTKVVNNRGPGSIRIGDAGDVSGERQEKVTKGPTRFPTTALRIEDLVGNVVVEVWDQSGMEVSMSGPKDALETIVAESEDSTLSIKDGGTERGSSGDVCISGVSIRTGRGGSRVSVRSSTGDIVIAGGNVTVISGSSSSNENIATVTVKVPKGADIDLGGVSGETLIGDVDGALNVNSKGNGTVRSGRMQGATVAVLGNGDVHISEVNGPLTAQIMGTGDIKVRSGAVTALTAQIMGTGDFTFGGVANTATLTVMGTGDIRVKEVKSRPRTQRMGTGDINVG
jgi:hypothetical protein